MFTKNLALSHMMILQCHYMYTVECENKSLDSELTGPSQAEQGTVYCMVITIIDIGWVSLIICFSSVRLDCKSNNYKLQPLTPYRV